MGGKAAMGITRWDVVAYPELGTKWIFVHQIQDCIEPEMPQMPVLETWARLGRRALSEEFKYPWER
jgi:hypothetical protein